MNPLLVRGRILTLDRSHPVASNVLLRGGVVTEFDSDIHNDVDILELDEGDTLQPGWRDDHVHLLSTLASRCSFDLSDTDSIDHLLERLSHAPTGDNGWIRAWGHDPSFLVEKRHPTSGDLDRVTKGVPAVLHDRTGHVAVVNTAAAKALGAQSHPDGILVEQQHILARTPRLATSDLKIAAQELFSEWRRRGLVTITDATHTNDLTAIAALGEIGDTSEAPRITAMVGADRLDGLRYEQICRGIKIGHAKVMPSVEGGTDLARLVRGAHEAGFPAAIHVMDIDTLEEALLALEASSPPANTVDRLEHCSLALPEQLDRIGELGVSVCTQPSFLTRRLHKYLEELSPAEQKWLWPLGSLTERDIKVTLSSDSPVVPADPSEWFEASTNRPLGSHEVISEDSAQRMAAVSAMKPGLTADMLVIANAAGYRPLTSRN
jgi:predicted amidohydrolase YtcJ